MVREDALNEVMRETGKRDFAFTVVAQTSSDDVIIAQIQTRKRDVALLTQQQKVGNKKKKKSTVLSVELSVLPL